MTHKTIAIIDSRDGDKYRVRKWSERHMTSSSEHDRPGRIDVQDPENKEWNHLTSWSAAGEHFNQTDDEVLDEAIKRLEIAFNAEPERIIYDNYEGPQIEPDGVTVEAL